MNKIQTFEFMYNDTWYKYENGYIYRQNIYGDFDQLTPVLSTLERCVDTFSLPDLQNIMGAIVHGYTCGKLVGAADKVKEVKRVLCIDERYGL